MSVHEFEVTGELTFLIHSQNPNPNTEELKEKWVDYVADWLAEGNTPTDIKISEI